MLKSLYIASTQGSGGKTTIAVGLCLAMRRRGLTVGYFKPVGTLRRAQRRPRPRRGRRASSPSCSGSRTTRPTSARSCSTKRPCTTSSPAPRSTPCAASRRPTGASPRARTSSSARASARSGRAASCAPAAPTSSRHLDLATLLVARFAGARLLDDIIYVKDALKEYLLGVLFNMVPETRLELVKNDYTDLPRHARRDELRRARLERPPLGRLGGRDRRGARRHLRVRRAARRTPGRDLHDRRHEPGARPALLPAHARTRS